VPEAILGSGAFGVVCVGLVKDSAVAVKLPSKSKGPKETARKLLSFCNELRVHRRLRHKSIVAFHGACVEPSSGDLALIFDLVHGIDMQGYVKRRLKPGEDAPVRWRLLFNVSSALSYLHSLSPTVVHGDIKATNIIVEELKDGAHAKLLDMGLARLMTKEARPLGGTPYWMAPELIQRKDSTAKPKTSADVFSFGVLTYFTVSGQRPADRQELSEPSSEAWAQAMPFRDVCFKLCQLCLRTNPCDRPSMSESIEHLLDWSACLTEEEISDLCKVPDIFARSKGGIPWEAGIAEMEERSKTRQGPACTTEAQRQRKLHL